MTLEKRHQGFLGHRNFVLMSVVTSDPDDDEMVLFVLMSQALHGMEQNSGDDDRKGKLRVGLQAFSFFTDHTYK